MATLDLNKIGIPRILEINGTIKEYIKDKDLPTVFLFDENHGEDKCIDDNLEDAIQLINAALVNLIGVESYHGGEVFDENNEKYLGECHDEEIFIEDDKRKRFANTMIKDYCEKVYGVECFEMHDKISRDINTPSNIYYNKDIDDHHLNRRRSKHFIKTIFEKKRKYNISDNLILNAGGNHNSHIVDWINSNEIEEIAKQPANYIRITSTNYK